uniref:Phosphatidylinositol N-acetylglucosaminyltransferase subunit A n=1 Tax=Aceria tosichella TaxID=561515 RepID=A0A6G1SGB6_9ACAR
MHICMASDFFYPNTGGVEAHIWQLGQCLVQLGHKVIVITHAYGDRIGVRFMPNSLKVYYLPYLLYPKQNIKWPFVFNTFADIRKILISEQIDIVHGHSAFSPMAHEVMFHAKALAINTVFTDHSLFGFNDIGSMIHSSIVKQSLLQCNHIVCVSHVGKQNKALQHEKIPITVIPNAVDTLVFTPDPSKRDPNKITIIVNSRLVYRKGVDLLAAVLPEICNLNPKVQFIIAGDGPKRILLEQAVEYYDLHDRVNFLGSIPHDQVRDVLVRGDIFLNTSLIEAFCMAIVEAASCGLQVVSTNVGGLPEVLPSNLIKLTEPSVDGLLKGVKLALEDLETNKFVPPMDAHKIIEKNYSWRDVARRTERVYKSVIQEPVLTIEDRFGRYLKSGFLGCLFFALILIDHLLLSIHDWLQPRERIDICPTSHHDKLEENSANGNEKVKTNGTTSNNHDKRNGFLKIVRNGHYANGDQESHFLASNCKDQSPFKMNGYH